MMGKLIEPTEEERLNGWTAEALTAYHAQREAETAKALDWTERPKLRATAQNSRYNIQRHWRR
jgi:hypothetical protein